MNFFIKKNVLVISSCLIIASTLRAMDTEQVPTLLNALAQTTSFPVQPAPRYGMHNTISVLEAQYEVTFKEALQSPAPQRALELLAQPCILERSDVKDGKIVVRKSVYTHARTLYALGLFALQNKDTIQANDYFKQAERSALYKTSEAPYEHAAAFARLLLSHQQEQAFTRYQELQKLVPLYPSCASLCEAEQRILLQARCVPLLELQAKNGSLDDRYGLLKAVCIEAQAEKTVDLQYEKVSGCMQYVALLTEHPEYRSLCEIVRLYANVAQARDHASEEDLQALIDVLLMAPQDPLVVMQMADPAYKAVTTLIQNLVDQLQNEGNLQACLYCAARDIQSHDKKVRSRAFEELQKLLLHMPGQNASYMATIFKRFNILSLIEKRALQDKNAAALKLYVHVQALTLFTQPIAFLKTEKGRKECKKIRKLALSIPQKKAAKRDMHDSVLEMIVLASEAWLAYGKNDLSIVSLAIKAQDTEMVGAVQYGWQQQAKLIVEALAHEGNLDALAWLAHSRVQQSNGALDETTKQYVRSAVLHFLDHAQEAQLEQQCGVTIQETLLKAIEKTNDPELRFLLSRFLFIKAHMQMNFTQEPHKLDECFAAAATASKEGVPAAKAFVNFLVRYRAAIGLLAQRKDDQAIDILCDVLQMTLPAREQTLVHDRFAYGVMGVAAANDNLKAQAWRLKRHCASNLAHDHYWAVTIMYQACTRWIEGAVVVESDDALKRLYTLAAIPLLMDRLELYAQTDADPVMRAQAAVALSFCLALKARSLNQDLATGQLADCATWQEQDFSSAITYMKEAKRMVKGQKKEEAEVQAVCKLLLGTLCMHVSQMFLEKNLEGKAKDVLREGALLDNPYCLRAYACLFLSGTAPIEKTLFVECIDNLRRAYALGDIVAGNILARHYFDGIHAPFPCGGYLAENKQRAFELAIAIGPRFKETQRILGHYHIDRAKRIHKMTEQITVAIQLAISYLQMACDNGCEDSLLALYLVTQEPLCSQGQQEEIRRYIQKKAEDQWPVAMSCQGQLLIDDPAKEEEAISLFRAARKVSNGYWASVELLEYHAKHFEIGMSEEALLEAADCAISLLSDEFTVQDNIANVMHIMRLVRLLSTVENGVSQESQKRLQAIERLLKENGIEYTSLEEDDASVSKLMQQGWQPLVQKDVAVTDTANGSSDVLVKKEMLFTDQFNESLTQIEQACTKLNGNQARKILNDTERLQQVEQAAHANHVTAQYILSNMRLYQAEQESGSLDEAGQRYLESITWMFKALEQQPNNPKFIALLQKVWLSVCNFYASKYIDYQMYNAAFIQSTYTSIETVEREIKEMGCDTPELKAALDTCYYTFARTGYVPALERLFSQTFSGSASKEQERALEAFCRALLACEMRNEKEIEESGMLSFIGKYHSRIEELADKKSPFAAQCLFLYPAQLNRVKKPLSAEHLARLAKKLVSYRTIVQQKCGAFGVGFMSEMMLMREPCTASQFKKIVAQLESLQDKEVGIAELLLQLYMGNKTGSGQSLPKDLEKAKKIAIKIKDKSIRALRALQRIAYAEHQNDHALLLKLEEVNRVGCLDDDLFEMARMCISMATYPRKVLTFLHKKVERGNVAALVALANIATGSKDFDNGFQLLKQLLEHGGKYANHAHFHLALLCLEKDSAYFSINDALEHIVVGMEKRGENGADPKQAVAALKIFGQALIGKLKDALIAQDKELQMALEKSLEKVCDFLHEPDCFDTTLESKLIKLAYCVVLKHDYQLLMQDVAKILALYKKSAPTKDQVAHVRDVMHLLMLHLSAQMQECKETDIKRAIAIETTIMQLSGTLQELAMVNYSIIPIVLK